MNNFKNVLWGIILVVLGVIIGTNSLGLTDINLLFDGWWTLFIIVPCFIGLFTNSEKTGNIIGILIGVALLLGINDIIAFDKIFAESFLVVYSSSILTISSLLLNLNKYLFSRGVLVKVMYIF